MLRASFKRLSDMLGGQDVVAVPALAYPFAAVSTALRQLSQVIAPARQVRCCVIQHQARHHCFVKSLSQVDNC